MIQNYSRFIAKICNDENLQHCTPDGVAAIIEWAVEHAGSQQHITLKFSDVADILREAAFYDRNSGDTCIRRKDVEKAIKWRRKRNDLLDEKIKQSILEGTMLIDTRGERVGQINGLTVLNDGILSFGKPARITSTISAGSAGIINIEREVEMSGPIHNKGVMIINGFFRERFAAKNPLAFTASIAFEQSYSGVDGDSASAAEIYVLMSSITGIPIKQNFAITGSMNQKGDIQPIGGVNEKITGYWEICREMGFTGKHAVIIPEQNVRDLMLPREILDSVEEGNFKIYAISKIEDGAELLLGKKAGLRKANGKFPKDSLFAMVEARFEELRKSVKAEPEVKKPVKKPAKKIQVEEEDN
jgi:lon-related putative ATP-dependent protease